MTKLKAKINAYCDKQMTMDQFTFRWRLVMAWLCGVWFGTALMMVLRVMR